MEQKKGGNIETVLAQGARKKNASFCSQNKCFETKEYAKIFCEIFARESIKNYYKLFS